MGWGRVQKRVDVLLEFRHGLVRKGEHQVGGPAVESSVADHGQKFSSVSYRMGPVEKTSVFRAEGLDSQGEAVDACVQKLVEQFWGDCAGVGLQGDFG